MDSYLHWIMILIHALWDVGILLVLLLLASIGGVLSLIIKPTNNNPKSIYEAIDENGFEFQDHTVTTDDGYELTLHRLIQKGSSPDDDRNGPRVLLQHGLYQSSMLFLVNQNDDCLAYTLYKHGYDVWLGDNRGNIHSKSHKSLSKNSNEYWNWSLDDLAYDVKANISYIYNHSGTYQQKPIFYIGHSQGGSQGLVAFSLLPDIQKMVHGFIALSPGAFVERFQSPFLRFLAALAKLDSYKTNPFLIIFGSRGFLPIADTMRHILPPSIFEELAYIAFKYLFEWSDSNWIKSRRSLYFAETPAGTSSKTMEQWFQQSGTGLFHRYSHGREKNMTLYGQPSPPSYPLGNISIPVFVVYGGKDVLLNFEKLISMLPNCVQSKCISHHEHLDTIMAVDAKTLIYPHLLEFLKKYSK